MGRVAGRALWAAAWLAASLLGSGCREPGTRNRDPGDPVAIPAPDAGPPIEEPCPPLCPPPPARTVDRRPGPNPVPAENALPGTPSWRDGRTGSAGEVELYLSTDSAAAGQPVRVMVSTSTSLAVRAELFRIGHYGGAGARRVWTGGPFPARRQPACPRDAATSLVECRWDQTFAFTVEPGWPSGYYAVKVSRPDGFRRFAPLVIRDGRAAELLYTATFNTSQAYNVYGGESLYQDASGTMPQGRAYQVSFDRPYLDYEGLGKTSRQEIPLVQLLERNGYDVTYATNLDFLRFSDLAHGVGMVVHGSHDEYWAPEQRFQLETALQSGQTSLAYFGGNGAYWRVRALSSTSGEPLRTLACYKGEAGKDPVPGSTVRFRDEPNALPESLLLGSMYDGWQLIPFPLVVKDPAHWLFEGTGLQAGEQLVDLLGYEYDRVFGPELTPPGVRVAMESPVIAAEGYPSVSQVVERTLPSGRLVFSAGTIWWALGLSAADARDGRLERMTLNVLERGLEHWRPRRSLPPPDPARPAPPVIQPVWARSVDALAGVAGEPGWLDGPGDQARFQGPTGLVATAAGEVVVADTGNNAIRLIGADPARTVSTIAGNGEMGFRDGPGAQAMFRWPTGVAVGPGGAIYVADSDNHVIRRLERAGAGWQVSLWAGAPRQQGAADGPAQTARFRRPTALAVDGRGNLLVADQANHRIRRIDAATRTVSTVAGSGIGYADAPQGSQARFNNPSAIAVSPEGAIYVLDTGNQRLRRIGPSPPAAVTTLTGLQGSPLGYRDGAGTGARFRAQLGMAFSPYGEVMVADTGNFRIRKVQPGADAAASWVFTIAGSGRMGTTLGPGEVADLAAPAGLAYLPNERIAVSDSHAGVIRIITR